MFTVEVGWTADNNPTEDQLFDICANHGAAASHSDGRKVHVTLTADATTMAEAVNLAIDYIGGIIPGSADAIEVMTTNEQDRRLALPSFPALAGVAEVADLLGVNRQRASALQTRAGFPAPIARLRGGPVWRKADIGRFADTWERKPGRPRKKAPTPVAGHSVARPTKSRTEA